MSTDAEFKFLVSLEIGVDVQLDAEIKDAEFEAKQMAVGKAEQLVRAVETISSIVGDTWRIEVVDAELMQ